MPQVMFEDLGLKYIGPVNGHDIAAVETALRRGRSLDEPVLVHMITEKGRGYTPAEEDIADRFHAFGPIHPETGLPVAPERFGWTGVFADEICAQAATRDDIVGITAAMMRPVGLGPMHEAYPGRVIDVGIAEAEAVASAAGMAYQGAHPVVALYATFLNRGFDQLLMDVALHRAGVTFVLDRAGVTGADGASHNGVWDIAMCSMIPGLRLAAPRDEKNEVEAYDAEINEIAPATSRRCAHAFARLSTSMTLPLSSGTARGRCPSPCRRSAASGEWTSSSTRQWLIHALGCSSWAPARVRPMRSRLRVACRPTE